jgi:hypothetical protein
MNGTTTPLEALFERAEDYGKTTVKLFKLHVIDKSADVVSSLVSHIAVIMMVLLSITITSIGVSFWIGKMIGEIYYGFLIVGGFYAFSALLFHLFRNQWLKNPVSNLMIGQMMKTRKHEKN